MDGSRGNHILSVGGQHIDPHERKIENNFFLLAGTKMIAADGARNRNYS